MQIYQRQQTVRSAHRFAILALMFAVAATPTPTATPSRPPGPTNVADSSPGELRVNPKDSLAYVWIPPGALQMGCVPADGECRDREKPRHSVTLSEGFWLGRTEVTVAAFENFVAATAHLTDAEKAGWSYLWDGRQFSRQAGMSWRNAGFLQEENHPVVNVSWDDAQAYCAWAGGQLPTEAQWEYAARGGLGGATYVWGTDVEPVVSGVKQGNVADETGKRKYSDWIVFPGYDDGYEETSPVASFSQNGFGLYDMAGNVWEWCVDWHGADYYSISPATDPQGPLSGAGRVRRGGSWNDGPTALRVSNRPLRVEPQYRDNNLGFRCALDSLP